MDIIVVKGITEPTPNSSRLSATDWMSATRSSSPTQPGRLPNFLTSLYVPATAVGNGNSLNYAGRLGQLPYYSDDVESSSSDDGLDAITDLLKGYLALEPHARAGFRVAATLPAVEAVDEHFFQPAPRQELTSILHALTSVTTSDEPSSR